MLLLKSLTNTYEECYLFCSTNTWHQRSSLGIHHAPLILMVAPPCPLPCQQSNTPVLPRACWHASKFKLSFFFFFGDVSIYFFLFCIFFFYFCGLWLAVFLCFVFILLGRLEAWLSAHVMVLVNIKYHLLPLWEFCFSFFFVRFFF